MTETIPGPAYRVETRRLVLRCYQPKDVRLLESAVIESLEHLKPWMPWAHREPLPLQERIDLLREFRGNFDLEQEYVFGIFTEDESRLVGGTGLHPRVGAGGLEIGYWIHQDFINQGYATESTASLVRVAFEINGVQRVEIHCDPDNVRSAAVPRKLGFSHEATLRKRNPFLDEMRDHMVWTLFAEGYPSSPAAGAKVAAYDAIGRRLL